MVPEQPYNPIPDISQPKETPPDPVANGYNKFIDGLARDIIERGIINEDAINEIRNANANNLPPGERIAQEQDTIKVREFTQDHQQSIAQRKEHQLKLMQLLLDPQTPEAQRVIIQDIFEKEQLLIKQDDERFIKLTELLNDANTRSKENLETAQIDKSTGLFTRRVLMNEFQEKFRTYLDGQPLPNIRFDAVDLLNFKVGNDVLTPSGFDIFFREMCKGYIGVSRKLGSKTDTYGEFSSTDLECTNALQKYFYGDDERSQIGLNLFKKVSERGIKITMFRDKSGGDEAYFSYELTRTYLSKEEEERDFQLGKELVDHIMGSSQIDKHEPQQLEKIINVLDELPFALQGKIRQLLEHGEIENRNDVEDTLIFLERMPTFMRHMLSRIKDDPECRISMGYACEHGSYQEAVINFFFGTDLHKNAVLDKDNNPIKSLLTYDSTLGKFIIDDNIIRPYRGQIINKVKIKLSNGSVNSDSIRNIVKDIIADDILGSYIQRKNDLVETHAKPESKKQLIINALCGNTQDLYQIGALIKSGRLLNDFTPEIFFNILQEVQTVFHNRFKTEDLTINSPLTDFYNILYRNSSQ